jgi:antirestriction protein ArdC
LRHVQRGNGGDGGGATDKFGDLRLIAEIGSAFLCAACRLEGRLQHASYVASWIKVLKADKRAVFAAAAKAQQAADYVESLAKPAPSAPAEIAKAA